MPLTEIQARNSKPRERAYKLADGEGSVAPRLVQGTWLLHRDHTLSDAAFRPDDERSGGLGVTCRLNLTNIAIWQSI